MSNLSMVFTGKNTAEMKTWASEHAPKGSAWFLTKSQTAPSGGQAWRFVMGEEKWPTAVDAAVYDPGPGEWLPVHKGDTVVQFADGDKVRFRVLRPVASA